MGYYVRLQIPELQDANHGFLRHFANVTFLGNAPVRSEVPNFRSRRSLHGFAKWQIALSGSATTNDLPPARLPWRPVQRSRERGWRWSA